MSPAPYKEFTRPFTILSLVRTDAKIENFDWKTKF
jgi:hypothetical protein